MGIKLPQRSKKFTDMLETACSYYQLLDERNLEIVDLHNKDDVMFKVEEYEKKLDYLIIPYTNNAAYAGYLAYIQSKKILKDSQMENKI